MFIINPLSGERMDNLFSTHPATENRIAALQAMAATGRGDERRRDRALARSLGDSRGSTAQPAEPEVQKPNPWGRNPTGPKGRRL